MLGDATFNTSGNYEVLDENNTYSMLVWIPRYAYKITSMYHKSGSGAGKYEASNNGGKIQIKAGVTSRRNLTISQIYSNCINMNESGNTYGISSDDSIVDPHMMKNTEWGAIVYLSQSIYGKNGKIDVNTSSSYYTGGGTKLSYINNIGQSTTGNLYGIYDMVGGSYEYVAAYYKCDYASEYGNNLVTASEKYKDEYLKYSKPSASNKIYGDATWETSNSSENGGWYVSDNRFPDSDNPFFIRGGFYYTTDNTIYDYVNDFGSDNSKYISFRVVIPVIKTI